MVEKKQKNNIPWQIICLSTVILFICSSTKHILFQSTAADLGIFDQAVYLISQGEKPISSFMGFHILADHAAWIWYPLALLYKIYPTVYWLFGLQAFALSFGGFPIWLLASQAGLTKQISTAIVIGYLLYPLIFNVNLFDFHLDVIVPSMILLAVWSARENKVWYFCLSIFLILGCKEVFALTTAAMGIWLALFEKRKLYGSITFIISIVWFVIATKIIIPFFSSSVEPIDRHIYRYKHLGQSLREVVDNIIFHPKLILDNFLTVENLFYLCLLLIPVIWQLSLRGLLPLFGAIPTLLINLLADPSYQKDLLAWYSLPILPFLFLAVIETLKKGDGWLKTKRSIFLWSLLAFILLAKYGFFWSKYLVSLDNWQSMNEAISLVNTQQGVYTTDEIAPHLTHRKLIRFANMDLLQNNLDEFNYVLLNLRHPGLYSNRNFVQSLIKKLENNPEFHTIYQNDEVYLFKR